MSDYTPSTEAVRRRYASDLRADLEAAEGQFDRWLATHDADKDAEIADLETRLSHFLDNSTGGMLSKTNYDVRTMIQYTDEHYEKIHREYLADAWDEGFEAGECDYLQHETFDEPCIKNPYR